MANNPTIESGAEAVGVFTEDGLAKAYGIVAKEVQERWGVSIHPDVPIGSPEIRKYLVTRLRQFDSLGRRRRASKKAG